MKNLVVTPESIRLWIIDTIRDNRFTISSEAPETNRANFLTAKHAKSIIAGIDFPTACFEKLHAEQDLSDVERSRLCSLHHLLEVEFYKAKASSASDAPENEADEEAENPEEDIESEEDEGTGAAAIREKLREYTFGPELAKIYKSALERRPSVLIIHNTTVIIKDKTISAWELTKERIKSILSAMGLEGIFIAIDYAADRYAIVRIILKCIGSAIVPVFIAYILISTLLKILQNPFKHILNWLAKEFDFKSTEPEPAE